MFPGSMVAILTPMTADGALDLYARDASLQPLHEELCFEANPIPVKWVVARMALIGNGIRPPLVELSASHQDSVLRAMRKAGVSFEDQAA
jgi:4-hydroxy-tetrahydrodipicolinate synthase